MDAVDKIAAFLNGMTFEEIEAVEKRERKFRRNQYGASVLEALR